GGAGAAPAGPPGHAVRAAGALRRGAGGGAEGGSGGARSAVLGWGDGRDVGDPLRRGPGPEFRGCEAGGHGALRPVLPGVHATRGVPASVGVRGSLPVHGPHPGGDRLHAGADAVRAAGGGGVMLRRAGVFAVAALIALAGCRPAGPFGGAASPGGIPTSEPVVRVGGAVDAPRVGISASSAYG